jgi:hypothetical protein
VDPAAGEGYAIIGPDRLGETEAAENALEHRLDAVPFGGSQALALKPTSGLWKPPAPDII